jgi:hypothetical protein
MQRIGFLVVLVLSWLAAGSSQAQVRDGDLRLYLDASVVSWMKLVSETEALGVSSEDETITLSSGALVGGGVGLGYAVTRYLLPELYVSLQNVKIDANGADATVRQWELRPCLEVPLLPGQRFVPFVVGGMTLGRIVSKGDLDDELTMFGLGPALGVGAHAFLTEHASLDLALAFRGTFFVKNDVEEDLPDGVEFKIRQYALLLTVGASFWL